MEFGSFLILEHDILELFSPCQCDQTKGMILVTYEFRATWLVSKWPRQEHGFGSFKYFEKLGLCQSDQDKSIILAILSNFEQLGLCQSDQDKIQISVVYVF
jgi:hypothetical protein